LRGSEGKGLCGKTPMSPQKSVTGPEETIGGPIKDQVTVSKGSLNTDSRGNEGS